MSPDKDGPRDWDKELAQIEPPPVKAAQAAQAAQAARSGRGAADASSAAGGRLAAMRHTPFFTWVRLLLALGLGIGMTQWPYTHGCGLPLYGYMAGVATVIVASFWTMLSSWKSRSGLAHFLSIALLFWGTGLAAREILPRTGYARQPASWVCSAEPTQLSPR
jgi:hypothetical protein